MAELGLGKGEFFLSNASVPPKTLVVPRPCKEFVSKPDFRSHSKNSCCHYAKDFTQIEIIELGRKLKKIILQVKHNFSDQFESANILCVKSSSVIKTFFHALILKKCPVNTYYFFFFRFGFKISEARKEDFANFVINIQRKLYWMGSKWERRHLSSKIPIFFIRTECFIHLILTLWHTRRVLHTWLTTMNNFFDSLFSIFLNKYDSATIGWFETFYNHLSKFGKFSVTTRPILSLVQWVHLHP